MAVHLRFACGYLHRTAMEESGCNRDHMVQSLKNLLNGALEQKFTKLCTILYKGNNNFDYVSEVQI